MHNLIYFLKDTLTVPKIKNLSLSREKEKYETIIKSLQQRQEQKEVQGTKTNQVDKDMDMTIMENELKKYLRTALPAINNKK